MHNVFKISLVVRREALSITLLVEGCTDLKNIVHFYRVRVTKFSTRGGHIARHRMLSSGQTDITFDFLLQLYRIAKKYEVDDLAILAADHFVQKLTTVQLSEVGNIVQSLLGEGGNLGEYLAAFMMREHNRLMQQPSFVSMLANHWPFLFQLMHNMGHWVLDVRSLPIEEDDASEKSCGARFVQD
ncbi:hypothetical protein D6C85_09189, partial [Aureobasidium pullulans]